MPEEQEKISHHIVTQSTSHWYYEFVTMVQWARHIGNYLNTEMAFYLFVDWVGGQLFVGEVKTHDCWSLQQD